MVIRLKHRWFVFRQTARANGLCLIAIVTATSADGAVLDLSAMHYTHAVLTPQAVVFGIVQARRRRREAIAKVLQATFERLQLYAHGARFGAWDESTQQALQRHLVRGLGSEAVDQLLLYQQVRIHDAVLYVVSSCQCTFPRPGLRGHTPASAVLVSTGHLCCPAST